MLKLSSLLFSFALARASWLILTVRPVGLLMVTGEGVLMLREEAVVTLLEVEGVWLFFSCLERRWNMMLRAVVRMKTARMCQEK